MYPVGVQLIDNSKDPRRNISILVRENKAEVQKKGNYFEVFLYS